MTKYFEKNGQEITLHIWYREIGDQFLFIDENSYLFRLVNCLKREKNAGK